MRRLLASGSVLLLATAAAVVSGSSPAGADRGCVTDPAGNVGFEGEAGDRTYEGRADLREVCLDHTPQRVRAEVLLEEPTDPLTDPGWLGQGAATVSVNVDSDGNGFDDNLVISRSGDALVLRGTQCSGTARYVAPVLVAEFDPSCLGDPAALQVAAYAGYPVEPDGTRGNRLYSFTEPSEPIARQSTQRRTSRVAGQTRIETAIAVSQRAFPDGAPVVYLAEATTFVDAVVAGVLTDGPVLLVPRCGPVPEAVLSEVRRLGATEVAAVGGPAAVCDELLQEAADA